MRWILRLILLGLVSCAGVERSCSACGAGAMGSDWVVVQYAMDGTPLRCWSLEDVSVANEPQSDGIYWLSEGGNLVHLSGQYNMVQVQMGRWEQAYKELGLSKQVCEAIHDRHFVPNSGWTFSDDPNN